MKMAPLAEVKDHFSSYVEKAHDNPIIVTKNGRPAAILVSVPDNEEDLERFLIAHSPKFQRLIESAYKRIQKGSGIKHRDFWRGI